MRSQVVHYYGQSLACVNLGQSLKERDEVLLVDSLIIQCEALEAASLTDRCENSRVLCTEGLAWNAEVLLAPAPLVFGVR